jgi:hypothetical protein
MSKAESLHPLDADMAQLKALIQVRVNDPTAGPKQV